MMTGRSKRSRFRLLLRTIMVIVAAIAGLSLHLSSFLTTPTPDHRAATSMAEFAPTTNHPSLRQKPYSPSATMSSCLLIMDDNHWLVEWLAYHYTTLNLRHLIVAIDERSRTSPIAILDRWQGKIDFELWNDTHYFTIPESAKTLQEINLARQQTFLSRCMRTLKKRRHGWVIFTDTDEFVSVNPRARRPDHDLYRPSIPPLTRPGSVMDFLVEEQGRNDTICFSMGRMQFSPDESSLAEINADVPDFVNASALLTTRWIQVTADDLAGPKNIVDLSKVSYEQIPSPKTYQHQVLPDVCKGRRRDWTRRNSLLQVYHYLGSYEQFNFRDDARKTLSTAGRNKRYDRYIDMSVGKVDDLRGWLRAFESLVGVKEAKRLLQGVGELDGWESAVANQGRFADPRSLPTDHEQPEQLSGEEEEAAVAGDDGADNEVEDDDGNTEEDFDDKLDSLDGDDDDAEDGEEVDDTEIEIEDSGDADDDAALSDEGGPMKKENVVDKVKSNVVQAHASQTKELPEEIVSLASPGASIFYSTARTDRSGAALQDMLLAHAYGFANNLTYAGACSYDALPFQAQTELLIRTIGLEDTLSFRCPANESSHLIVDRKLYIAQGTRAFTPNYLEHIRARIHYPVNSSGIVVHARRGDVSLCGQYANRYLPNSHYLDILKEYTPTGMPVSLYSESESLEDWSDFKNYSVYLDTDLPEVWRAMMSADYLVLSKSSFSFVPAMLNRNGTVIYTPFMHRKMDGWVTVNDDIMDRTKERVLELVKQNCTEDEQKIALEKL